MQAKATHGIAPAKSDTTTASQRLETQRPPGKKSKAVPARKTKSPGATKTPASVPPGSSMSDGMSH
jgi:hypothetical protein